MILFQGRVYDTMLQGELLGQLEARINDTRLGRGLEQERVIRGLVRLGQELREELENAAPGKTAGEAGNPWIPAWLGCLTRFLSREWLEYKIETELGVKAGKGRKSEPGGSTECGPGPSHEVYHYTELQKMETHILPLGTLLHITAGNMEGLPVFSIVEGLLTGNVNILKLPGNDGGLSMDIILRLIRLEPALADYIYVFDTSSGDLPAMRRLEEMADGIVGWGGGLGKNSRNAYKDIKLKLLCAEARRQEPDSLNGGISLDLYISPVMSVRIRSCLLWLSI